MEMLVISLLAPLHSPLFLETTYSYGVQLQYRVLHLTELKTTTDSSEQRLREQPPEVTRLQLAHLVLLTVICGWLV